MTLAPHSVIRVLSHCLTCNCCKATPIILSQPQTADEMSARAMDVALVEHPSCHQNAHVMDVAWIKAGDASPSYRGH